MITKGLWIVFYLEILFLAPKLDTHRFDCAWKQADHHILRPCILILICEKL